MVCQLLTVNRPLPKRLSDCLPPIDEKIGWQINYLKRRQNLFPPYGLSIVNSKPAFAKTLI